MQTAPWQRAARQAKGIEGQRSGDKKGRRSLTQNISLHRTVTSFGKRVNCDRFGILMALSPASTEEQSHGIGLSPRISHSVTPPPGAIIQPRTQREGPPEPSR